jgi:lysophospholipase L1-like esterase
VTSVIAPAVGCSQPTGPTSTPAVSNPRISAIAAAERLVLVDLYTALLSGVDSSIGVDRLHPTESGCRRIAETFFAAVVADLEVK